VDEWDHVAAALGLPPGSGRHVRAKYVDVLMEYERNEEKRLEEFQNIEGLPSWWDDGNFIVDNGSITPNETECWNSAESRPSTSVTVRSAIVKMLHNKYYKNYLNISKPFQRFHVKDSWLCAAMVNYQALICQLHLKHKSDS